MKIFTFLLAISQLSAAAQVDVEKIENHQFNVSTTPQFSGDHFKITPEKTELMNSHRLVVQDIDTVWDVEKFKYPRIPAKIGVVVDRDLFSKRDIPRCIHMPIKMPGSEIRIPQEYAQFTSELKKMLDYEYTANPNYDKYYAYLTVDVGFVPRETTQRVPGPHVDGLPRDRENPKNVIDHAYLVSDAVPTRFYFQSFDMSRFDLNKHHFFAIFRALADESQSILVKPYDINLMNAYSVHTPEVATEDTHRTILRLEFSVLDFDREGNSINPAFVQDDHYPFVYRPRPIPSHLTLPADIFKDQPLNNKMLSNIDFDHFGRERLVKELRDHPRGSSLYQDLEEVYTKIENGSANGLVVVYQHKPQGFILFEEKTDVIFVSMLYTHEKAVGKELTTYMMNTLKAKSKTILFVKDKHNKDMIPYFKKSAEIANVSYMIAK